MQHHQIHGITGKCQLVGVTNGNAIGYLGLPPGGCHDSLGKIGDGGQGKPVAHANLKLPRPGQVLQLCLDKPPLIGEQRPSQGGLEPAFETLMPGRKIHCVGITHRCATP